MASIIRVTSLAFIAGLGLAGCANDTGGYNMFGSGTTTASIPEKPKVDPACVSLTSQIDTLKKEGISEKIEKAAAKKYKMTQADLGKAAQLNKANADFQLRCSAMTTAQAAPATGADAAVRSQGETSLAVAQATTTPPPLAITADGGQ